MKKSGMVFLIFIFIISCNVPINETEVQETTAPEGNRTLVDIETSPGDQLINDGTMVIVDSGEDAVLGDIFLISIDGSSSEKLLDSGDNGYQHFGQADWSPDGSEIVFSALTPPWEIMTANADGSDIQAVPNTTGGEYPDWSPDGSRIAFSVWMDGAADIFVSNRDGSNLRNLTENFSANALDPSWSPDGMQLVFFGAEPGDDFELYTIMVDGLFSAQLTDNTRDDWAASWSPEGDEIAYLHDTEEGYTEVRVINLDTGNISERTSAFGYPDLSAGPGLCWMPDSERLVIVSQGDVYISRYDGGVIFEKIWDGMAFTSYPSCK